MTSQNTEIRLRDEFAEKYDSLYSGHGILHDWVEKNVIAKMLKVQQEDTVLDVGCGTGRITLAVAKNCNNVVAVDFSQKSLDILDRKVEQAGLTNISIKKGDILDGSLFSKQFDKVVGIQVIQHIPTKELRIQALHNVYEWLKPNGICVISVYNYSEPSVGYFASGLYYKRFKPKELVAHMKDAGFKNIVLKGCVNFRWYHFLDRCYKLFYPLAELDLFLSEFNESEFTGTYLVARGEK